MHDDHDHDHDDPANPWADRVNEAYYDGMGAAFGEKTRERINWMCAQARGESVLDVGCSQGIASILMAREGMAVTGLDVFAPAIAYASKERDKEIESVRGRLHFRCAELSALRDVEYDTVVMGEVVEHQTNPIRFIKSGAALVGEGGRIVITVPFGLNPWPDHKSSIFPSDIQAALEDEFAIAVLEVRDGYLRAVADRRNGTSRAKVDHAMLARVTEQGALDSQKKFYEANARAGALEAGKRELERKLADLQGRHAVLDGRRAELEQQVALRTQSQADADRRVAEALALVEEHKRSVQESTAIRERHLERIEALVQESATHRAVSEQAGRTILSLEAARHEGASQLQDARGALYALERESAAVGARAQKDAEALKAQVEQLRQDAARAQQEIDRLGQEGARAQQELECFREQGAQAQQEVERFRRESAHAEQEIGRFREEDARARREIERLRREAASLRAESGKLRTRGTGLDAENAALRNAAAAAARDNQALQARFDGAQSELVIAQQKRSGHYAHLVAERERAEKLIARLRELHDDNQRYRHSIALALGRAGLGLMSVRGILGFPRALVGVARMYRARRNGGPVLEPLVLPAIKPVMLAAPRTSVPAPAPGGAGVEAMPATSTENVKTLSVLGWRQALNPALMPVMSVLDEFSRSCFAPQAALIEPRPDNWEGLVDQYRPKFLFVESSWKGNYGAWQYRVSGYAHPPGQELAEMVAGCRARGIPTVFWNKEDPVHFTNFIEAASKFDLILTTAADAVAEYQERTPAKVGVLQFAAEETLHNPIGSAKRNEKLCFAGSFYANRFRERREDQLMLLDAGSAFDFDIYDRNHAPGSAIRSDFEFPERFTKFIKGGIAYEDMCRAYRDYKVFLNVNSVIDSPTMFSRRVFELLACGTPIVSTWAKGTENTFGQDLVWHVRDQDEAEEAIRVLMTDDKEWRRRSLAGIRAVFDGHTYRHRFAEVLGMLDVPDLVSDHFNHVLVVGEAENQLEANAVIDAFRRQKLPSGMRKHLVLAKKTDFELEGLDIEADVVEVGGNGAIETLDRIRSIGRHGLIATISAYGMYGRHYLHDLIHAARYSGAAIVGKSCDGQESSQYAFGASLDPKAILINEFKLAKSGNESLEAVLRGDIARIRLKDKEVYASDCANYVRLESLPDSEHVVRILQQIEL